MLAYILLLFFSLIPLYILYSLYHLEKNYLLARKTGLPIIILPIDCGNPLWQTADQIIIPLCKKLPFGNGNFTRFNFRGWELRDRWRAFEENGPAFIFVTPGRNWLQLADPEAVAEIYQRREDFVRPLDLLSESYAAAKTSLDPS